MQTAAPWGIEGRPVTVTATFTQRLPAFQIIGLPASATRETAEKVRSALAAAGFAVPRTRRVVELGPADLPKRGTHYDLPIALAVLLAMDGTSPKSSWGALGELSLNGEVRPIRGLVPLLQGLKQARVKHVLVPAAQAQEALLVRGISVHPIQTLREAWTTLFSGPGAIRAVSGPPARCPTPRLAYSLPEKLKAPAQRVLAALRKGQPVLLRGPYGSGKQQVVRWAVAHLPNLPPRAAMEVAAIRSASGLAALGECLPTRPPFSAPHHTVSLAGMIGSMQGPGEVTVAHRGVLFLDEVAEFPRVVLEAVRSVQQEGVVRVSGLGGGFVAPAKFTLVAALTTGTDGDERAVNRVWGALWTGERAARPALVNLG